MGQRVILLKNHKRHPQSETDRERKKTSARSDRSEMIQRDDEARKKEREIDEKREKRTDKIERVSVGDRVGETRQLTLPAGYSISETETEGVYRYQRRNRSG